MDRCEFIRRRLKMKDIASLSHTRWECKYHIVFIPKYRRKAMYKELRKYLGEIFHELARHRGCKIEEGHLLPDHVHMLISIPPKYSVSQVMGYICLLYTSPSPRDA